MEQIKQMMSLVIKPEGVSPVYNCMLTIKDEKSGSLFSDSLGTAGESGGHLSADYRFKTGSITKLFTATIIIQLIEKDFLRLEDYLFDLIDDDTKRILAGLHIIDSANYSNKISIHHLLEHSSGLRDYFSDDERFLDFVINHPKQSWNWKLVMEKYFEFGLNSKPSFVPGQGFHYSDTNYLLLGILIEQITNKPLQQIYKEKIFTPLGLCDTYLEFYELPDENKPVVYPYYGIHSLENTNTSFDWGGGGLISTMNDLDVFIRSLSKGNLFEKRESVKLMMNLQNKFSVLGNKNLSTQYGLGIQKKDYFGYSFIGHNSAYGSMLFYEPDKDVSIILTLNQGAAVHKAEWLMKKIVDSFQKEEII